MVEELADVVLSGPRDDRIRVEEQVVDGEASKSRIVYVGTLGLEESEETFDLAKHPVSAFVRFVSRQTVAERRSQCPFEDVSEFLAESDGFLRSGSD